MFYFGSATLPSSINSVYQYHFCLGNTGSTTAIFSIRIKFKLNIKANICNKNNVPTVTKLYPYNTYVLYRIDWPGLFFKNTRKKCYLPAPLQSPHRRCPDTGTISTCGTITTRVVDPDPHGAGSRRVNLSTKNGKKARKLLITATL